MANKNAKLTGKTVLKKKAPKHNTLQAVFLSLPAAPARRALGGKGITTLDQLSQFTETEILALHGMGRGSMPKLKSALKQEHLSFKK